MIGRRCGSYNVRNAAGLAIRKFMEHSEETMFSGLPFKKEELESSKMKGNVSLYIVKRCGIDFLKNFFYNLLSIKQLTLLALSLCSLYGESKRIL